MPFSRTSWGGGVGVLNSVIFNSFHNRVEFGTILEGLRNFGEGGLNPSPAPAHHWTELLRVPAGCSEMLVLHLFTDHTASHTSKRRS